MTLDQIVVWIIVGGIAGLLADALVKRVRVGLVGAVIVGILGAFIGGGTGWRYSYVDLALLDVERSVAVIRDILQRRHVTRRAWVLFFDDAFANVASDVPMPGDTSISFISCARCSFAGSAKNESGSRDYR